MPKKREQLEGLEFNNWLVLEYIEKGDYKCACKLCGAERDISGYFLKKGNIPKCTCMPGRVSSVGVQDLKGKKFGTWTPLEYIGNYTWKCQCECGAVKNIKSRYLTCGKHLTCRVCSGKGLREDLTGKTFGEWTVLGYDYSAKMWKCRCSCGKEQLIRTQALNSGASKSCGHATTGFRDLTGQQFGDWTVLKYAGNSRWLCRCSCGVEKEIDGNTLRRGLSLSCGHAIVEKHESLIGKHFGEWEVLEFVGNNTYKCRCSCGKEANILKGNLTSGRSTSCGHNTTGFKDLTGMTFGEWTVLKYTGNQKYLCRCSCGVEIEVEAYNLCSGDSKSCGHGKNQFIDLTGKQVGEWTVIKYNPETRKWLCKCSCGLVKEVDAYALNHGSSKSCGHATSRLKDLIGKKFGDWEVISRDVELGKWVCRCSCGKMGELTTRSLLSGNSKSCGHNTNAFKNMEGTRVGTWKVGKYVGDGKWSFNVEDLVNIGATSSYKENELASYIENELGVSIIHNDRTVFNGKEIDILCKNLNIGIEFNGSYWHSSIRLNKKYHQNKTLDCHKSGIRLIQVFEYEWDDPVKRAKVLNILNSTLCNGSSRIHARDTSVSIIDNSEANKFLEEHHLQGGAICKYSYGMKYNDELIGVMTFGKPRFNSNFEYELIRFAWKNNIRVVGGAEKLFKAFITDMNPSSIITYSDISKFTGNVYTKLGFKTEALTEPNYVWVDTKNNNIYSRYQTMKQTLLDNDLGIYGDTEDEIMSNLGCLKVYDCGNLRLVWNKDDSQV